MSEAEIVEFPCPAHRPPKNLRARNVADAVNPAGQPFLVAKDQIDQRVEGERHEGEVMVLHPQRRIAEEPPDREAGHSAEHISGPERPSFGRQIGGDVGADADEGRLRQRNLPGIAQRQIEPDGGNRHHRPHAENEDAVGPEGERRGKQEHGGEGERNACDELAARPHTVRSSTRPSSPCGRNRMTTMRIRSGSAMRYCEDR